MTKIIIKFVKKCRIQQLFFWLSIDQKYIFCYSDAKRKSIMNLNIIAQLQGAKIV